MPNAGVQGLVGRRTELPGHFVGPVTVEHVRPLGDGAELRVRLANGELDETVLSPEDLTHLQANGAVQEATAHSPADAEKLRLLVESTRIRLAYAYDSQFAVSLSGIRTLPHQISAWSAVANLSDLAGKVTVSVSVDEGVVLDRHRLENGVLEPLRELGLIDDEASG